MIRGQLIALSLLLFAVPVAVSVTVPVLAADDAFTAVMSNVKKGEFEAASLKLFQWGRQSSTPDERMRVRYLLGLSLMEMGLEQVATYQFVDVIRRSGKRYVGRSLDKLAVAADTMNDETFINYAVARFRKSQLTGATSDLFLYRLGENHYERGKFEDAIRVLAKVSSSSRHFVRARYLQATAFAQIKKEPAALKVLRSLRDILQNRPPTDADRVLVQMAEARILYQAGQWEQAMETYHRVPRDSEHWHDALFEQSWAAMRSGGFRSALSHFQSLHSPYYETYYVPESLILRGIVYLYICDYDEMTKTIKLYEAIYDKLKVRLEDYLDLRHDDMAVFSDVKAYLKPANSAQLVPIPAIALKHVVKSGAIKSRWTHLELLEKQLQNWQARSAAWRNSTLGQYAKSVLVRRLESVESEVGSLVREQLGDMVKALGSLSEQNGFLRFEMLNAQKELLRKKIADKNKSAVRTPIDEDEARAFYVQNGYEYWPFRGEYWLDEIGNYHYLGAPSCE